MKTLFSSSKTLFKNVCGWALFATMLFSLGTPIFAQRGVTIGPLVVDKGTVDPGTTFEEVIRIHNEMSTNRPAKVGFYDVEPFGEEGRFKVIEDKDVEIDKRISMKSWVTLEAEQITLPPGEEIRWKEFKVTVHVPADALPGVHYGMLLITPDASKALDEMQSSGMVLQQRQGSAFILNIAGDVKEEGTVTEFSVNPSFSEYPPINFLARIQNNGTNYIKPVGTITIKNVFGFVTDTIPFNQKDDQESKRALPNMIRKFEETWNNAWLTYTEKEGLKVDWTKFPLLRMGPYTAVLDATYGAQGNKTLTASVGFWVLPWKLLLMLVALIIIIFSLFTLFIALMKKRAIESYQKQQAAEHEKNTHHHHQK